jgi:hypothetical protein
MEEVRLRFGRFSSTDVRVRLFDKLDELVAELRRSGLFVAVVVDGSFVTAKPNPGDVDIVIVLRRNHDWTADLPPSQYNLVSRRSLRRRTGFDVLLATDGGPLYERYVEFFGRVREDASVRKGILRIEL